VQRHLGSGQGGQHHELVQGAQMADPEQAAGHLAEPNSE
jgi:hypothetical protein